MWQPWVYCHCEGHPSRTAPFTHTVSNQMAQLTKSLSVRTRLTTLVTWRDLWDVGKGRELAEAGSQPIKGRRVTYCVTMVWNMITSCPVGLSSVQLLFVRLSAWIKGFTNESRYIDPLQQSKQMPAVFTKLLIGILTSVSY